MNKVFKIRHRNSKLFYNAGTKRKGEKWVTTGTVYYSIEGAYAVCRGILRSGPEILSGFGPEGESIGPFDIEVVEFLITEGISHVFGNFEKKKKR